MYPSGQNNVPKKPITNEAANAIVNSGISKTFATIAIKFKLLKKYAIINIK